MQFVNHKRIEFVGNMTLHTDQGGLFQPEYGKIGTFLNVKIVFPFRAFLRKKQDRAINRNNAYQIVTNIFVVSL